LLGTAGRIPRFDFMDLYSYSVTDLAEYESPAVDIVLEQDEATAFGLVIAKEMLKSTPGLTCRGMCIVLYDSKGVPISLFPLDPIQ
jgi:hypothetical protein